MKIPPNDRRSRVVKVDRLQGWCALNKQVKAQAAIAADRPFCQQTSVTPMTPGKRISSPVQSFPVSHRTDRRSMARTEFNPLPLTGRVAEMVGSTRCRDEISNLLPLDFRQPLVVSKGLMVVRVDAAQLFLDVHV